MTRQVGRGSSSRWARLAGERIRWVWILLLSAAVLSSAPLAVGAPQSVPPFTPGTTWTYTRTAVLPTGTTTTGTRTVTYGGLSTYRDKSYYHFDDAAAEGVERGYYTWTDGHFRQVALVAKDTDNHVLEILFDKPWTTDVEETLSGSAQVFLDNVAQGELPWSITVSRRGTVTTTVPVGTFQATRWEFEFQLGGTKLVSVSESVGFVDLRAEVKVYRDGVLERTVRYELKSGPVQ